MKLVKELATLIIILIYFISWTVTLSYLDVLIAYPVAAFISAIFGIGGGCTVLSLFLKQFRSVKGRKGYIVWYKSSSIFFGTVFFLLGLVTLVPIFHFVNLLKSQQFVIGSIWKSMIFFLIVLSLILAIINYKNEE